ncbi:hypothetical protein NGUA10_00010 [Salmonella enterica]|nr:hypothetical protein NGUA10_00010 [Salmonella enterica]
MVNADNHFALIFILQNFMCATNIDVLIYQRVAGVAPHEFYWHI